jgi:hypothetical protein
MCWKVLLEEKQTETYLFLHVNNERRKGLGLQVDTSVWKLGAQEEKLIIIFFNETQFYLILYRGIEV